MMITSNSCRAFAGEGGQIWWWLPTVVVALRFLSLFEQAAEKVTEWEDPNAWLPFCFGHARVMAISPSSVLPCQWTTKCRHIPMSWAIRASETHRCAVQATYNTNCRYCLPEAPSEACDWRAWKASGLFWKVNCVWEGTLTYHLLVNTSRRA